MSAAELKIAIAHNGKDVLMELPDRTDHIQGTIASSGSFYELDLLQELERLPIEPGIICDVGANIGNHTLYFSAIMGRKVYAFEPLLRSFDLLKRNVAVNALEAQVSLFNVALGEKKGAGEMDVVEHNSGASRFILNDQGPIQMEFLDNIIGTNEKVSVIKIDVEGYELQVLQGAKETIAKNRPLLIVEVQDHIAFTSISTFMRETGYFPVSVKARTPTVFFAPEESFQKYEKVSTFLVRRDLEEVRGRIQGQLDRISKKLDNSDRVEAEISIAEKELLRSISEQKAIIADGSQALTSIQELQKQLLNRQSDLADSSQAIRKQFDVQARHITNTLDLKLSDVSEKLASITDQAQHTMLETLTEQSVLLASKAEALSMIRQQQESLAAQQRDLKNDLPALKTTQMQQGELIQQSIERTRLAVLDTLAEQRKFLVGEAAELEAIRQQQDSLAGQQRDLKNDLPALKTSQMQQGELIQQSIERARLAVLDTLAEQRNLLVDEAAELKSIRQQQDNLAVQQRDLIDELPALKDTQAQQGKLIQQSIEQASLTLLETLAEHKELLNDETDALAAIQQQQESLAAQQRDLRGASQKIREQFDVQARHLTKTFGRELDAVKEKVGTAAKQQEALLKKLETNQAQIEELEGEIARLLIVAHTEKTRAQLLGNRLKHLYTSGPRHFVARILAILKIITFRRIKGYETWSQYEERLAIRLKREVDGFKKMHTRIRHFAERKPSMRVEEAFVPPSPSHAQKQTMSLTSRSIAEPRLRRERVRIGIAAIEIRRTALSRVIDCLYDQADEIYVYLNDFSEIPLFLKREKIVVIHGKGDVGDRGKFYGVDDFDGYFISCDDDIEYPPYYVKHLIDGIERYGRKAAVGWHGSIFKHPFEDYYSNDSRRVFSFRSGRPEDMAVHVLGTGCTAFHSSTIRVKYEDFKTPNMADVYFALLGQQQSVPFVVLKHDAAEALPLDIPDDKPIHRESMQKTGSKADTRLLQNKLVKEHGEWRATLPAKAFDRPVPTVAYIGRLNIDRWKKGGILKSGHLILDSLRMLGHRVIPVEIEQDADEIFKAIKDAKIVWIYPGDPERPDFLPVEKVIEHAASMGKQVYVNLSFNLVESRTRWIASKVGEWSERFGGRVKACLFTKSALVFPEFESLRDNPICIPKTIEFDGSEQAEFHRTSGIFLGDLQKLLNRALVGGDIEDWLTALRAELPGAPLYAVRQYGGKIDRELGLEVVPYTKGAEWEKWLSSIRVAACMTPHATYEMIPVEMAGLGVPLVYRPMVHAHTEVMSIAGIQVRTPTEFAKTCKALYTDPLIWESYSRAGHYRATSQHIEFVAAAIHQQLVLGMSH